MMSDFTVTAALVILYRSLTVLSGLAIVFLGYRLFRVGVYEKAGDLKAAWGEKFITLKQAAPGTFFALFGAAVIIAGIWRGVSFDRTSRLSLPEQPTGRETTQAGGAEAQKQNATAFVRLAKDSLPEEVAGAIRKASEGQSLTAEEQTLLKNWLDEGKERTIIIAHGPDLSKPLTEGLRDSEKNDHRA